MPRSVLPYLLLALIQGLACLQLWNLPEAHWVRVALYALVTATLVGGLLCQLLWGRLRQARTWLPVLLCTLLFAALVGWFAWQFSGPLRIETPYGLGFSTYLSLALLLYILCPFVQAWPSRRGWGFDYQALFAHAWNNAFVLLLGGLLVGAFWLLIWLSTALLGMLGVGFLKWLLFSQPFVCLSTPMVFALGLRLGLERVQVIEALRTLLLGACHLLLPLSTLIVLLFLGGVLFSGLEPLWQTRSATPILLSLLLIHLLLINGVVQDGTREAPYARSLRALIGLSLLLAPVLALLAGYALWLRIGQYGLTPSRVFAVVAAAVCALHALALAFAALRQSPWLASLSISNPPIAWATAVLLILLQTPVLNPLELTAANQYQRLLAGNADRSALHALQFRYGEVGKRYYERLRQTADLPQPLAEWIADKETELLPATAQWLGAELPNTDELLQFYVTRSVCRQPGCYLMALDMRLDTSSDTEQRQVLWLDATGPQARLAFIVRDAEGEWRVQTVHHLREDSAQVLERLRQGNYQLEAPRYRRLVLGDKSLQPTESPR
ncbi:conserved membrane hypothetical protein [Pseudomonas sp. 8Z]|uniref:DUF4153 domain-containing protein n=1 Tax=Pseudomonas sp. 8Z TaxID=2653166 RepID=UPI0012F2ED82|nr:DUF4153 domain-containing protein [Pseudomonas sp. 8Z]VXC96280.1 conserved membrane hypothetical protein [Pseudomonas sp. 8Z]